MGFVYHHIAIPIFGQHMIRRIHRHDPPARTCFDFGLHILHSTLRRLGHIISALLYMNELRLSYTSDQRSEEHTSELQSLMRISYAVFCLKKKKTTKKQKTQ